ncbi:MAG: DUF4453 domain-containing protein [Pseudomonadota bacterium]
MLAQTVGLALGAGAASASAICDDLWFSRNSAYDSIGYCFQSPLGRAVFDNSDCTGAPPVVDASANERIGRIRALEQQLRCRVDTDRTSLDLPLLERRRPLDVQPVRTEGESLCIGYIGPSVPLRVAPSDRAEVIGMIEPGDSVLARHVPEDGWAFASQVARPESLSISLGWHDSALDFCEARTGLDVEPLPTTGG